ncbi:GntR family transcriptional regulator [Glycomyces sp. TRM65418]|uniref:GntR family transcriptional regulator n=1 Tax=Glycomyces sp. TRM65418 TaxID=2867006 RepID=UPI001CE4C166|nr:GntR family transcriptional regulator [Glycomyces sp. TRM65418]MCC3762478.1 GntR family transcriptional regulator [Glycomyces sp. TRM65418]QZD56522.1 GntR family transcriptional regulator [Glycomyces sp. TRM65418]
MEAKQGSAAATAAEALRQRILDGTYAPGQRLPSATAIGNEFGIDRGTAARVLAQLRQTGFIITKPGSGSFVRTFEPILRSFPARLSAWQEGRAIQDADTGKRARMVEVTVGETPASEAVATAFDLAPGDPVLRRSRRFAVEDRPVQLADSHYLLELVRSTAIVYTDTGPGGVYARLDEIGHAPVRFTERLRARMPLPAETAALELPGGTPVIAITRTAFDAEDRCVEVTEMIIDASAYELEYHATI